MNKEQMNQYVINSLESLQTLVNGVEGCESTSLLLTETIDRINRSQDVRTPAPYVAVTRNPAPRYEDEYDNDDDDDDLEEEFNDGYTLTPGTDSYGIDPDTGEEVNAESWQGNIDQLNESIAEHTEYGDGDDEVGTPLEAIMHFSVSYSLEQGELTSKQVFSIINDPISETLNKFGKLTLLSIDNGESPAEKIAQFAVVEQGDFDLNGIHLGLASYQGRVPFPGIGVVTARANV